MSKAATPAPAPEPPARLSDSDLPSFAGNRRRNLAIAFVLLLSAGIFGAVYASQKFAATVPVAASASASSSVPPSASASGPPATVADALRLARMKKLWCFDQAKKKNPKLAGKVSIDFKLDDAGKVSEAKVSSTTLGDPEAEKCLLDVIRALEVQPPKKGEPREMTDTTEPL